LLDAVDVPWFHMSLGQMLRIPHGIVAQLYVCLLIGIAVACSKFWIERPVSVGDAVRHAGLVCCALLMAQLTIAAVMRHNAAGLAIPTFPCSTADGGWLPAAWDFRVGIHFAHRAMAVFVGAALIWLAVTLNRDPQAPRWLRIGGATLVALVVLQILLGGEIIWTFRRASMTTAHVVVGALLFALTFLVTWVAHRDRLEGQSAA